jgi:hypothetical protein
MVAAAGVPSEKSRAHVPAGRTAARHPFRPEPEAELLAPASVAPRARTLAGLMPGAGVAHRRGWACSPFAPPQSPRAAGPGRTSQTPAVPHRAGLTAPGEAGLGCRAGPGPGGGGLPRQRLGFPPHRGAAQSPDRWLTARVAAQGAPGPDPGPAPNHRLWRPSPGCPWPPSAYRPRCGLCPGGGTGWRAGCGQPACWPGSPGSCATRRSRPAAREPSTAREETSAARAARAGASGGAAARPAPVPVRRGASR